MKSYTDFEQSKKLANILPIESADMCYRIVAYNPNDTHVYQPYCFSGTLESDIPCWSLAALLGLMPITCILSISNGHYRIASNETNTFFHNNPLDAAFEMICWLKENKKI